MNRNPESAELAVIGGLMLRNDAFDDVADILAAEDFANGLYGSFYGAICTLAHAGKPFDAVTVAEIVGPRSLSKILEITQGTPSAYNVKHYADIVKRHSRLRRADAIAKQVLSSATTEEAEGCIGDLEEALTATGSDEPKLLSALAPEYEQYKQMEGWGTGWLDLDELTVIRPGQFVVIGARPKVGKSTLMFQVALRLAKHGVPGVAYSLEMGGAELFGRMERHGVEAPLWIQARGSLTIDQLRASVKRMVRKHGVRLVIVDYLQLVTGRGHNREQEVASVSRTCKQIALDMNVAVLAASQFNRTAAEHKRPRSSDFRESGSIEQDVDQGWLMHAEDKVPFPAVEVEVALNRSGPRGRVVLRHRPDEYRFVSMDVASKRAYWQSVTGKGAPDFGME